MVKMRVLQRIKEKRAEKKRLSAEKASWMADRPINTDLMQFSTELDDWARNKGEKND